MWYFVIAAPILEKMRPISNENRRSFDFVQPPGISLGADGHPKL
jgi:hypothetical protein